MLKRQRRKFEMFLRVREFYNARNAEFPAESVGGGLFAALLLIIDQLEQLAADGGRPDGVVRALGVADQQHDRATISLRVYGSSVKRHGPFASLLKPQVP